MYMDDIALTAKKIEPQKDLSEVDPVTQAITAINPSVSDLGHHLASVFTQGKVSESCLCWMATWGPPSYVCWFINHMNTIVVIYHKSTYIIINHGYAIVIGVICTNFAKKRLPHIL